MFNTHWILAPYLISQTNNPCLIKQWNNKSFPIDMQVLLLVFLWHNGKQDETSHCNISDIYWTLKFTETCALLDTRLLRTCLVIGLLLFALTCSVLPWPASPFVSCWFCTLLLYTFCLAKFKLCRLVPWVLPRLYFKYKHLSIFHIYFYWFCY